MGVVDRDLGKIPENLRPIFEATTAHESIGEVIELVKKSSPSEQKTLIQNQIFLNAVLSGLNGVDECRMFHTLEIVEAFSNENRGDIASIIGVNP